jgi:hypothetical protein
MAEFSIGRNAQPNGSVPTRVNSSFDVLALVGLQILLNAGFGATKTVNRCANTG